MTSYSNHVFKHLIISQIKAQMNVGRKWKLWSLTFGTTFMFREIWVVTQKFEKMWLYRIAPHFLSILFLTLLYFSPPRVELDGHAAGDACVALAAKAMPRGPHIHAKPSSHVVSLPSPRTPREAWYLAATPCQANRRRCHDSMGGHNSSPNPSSRVPAPLHVLTQSAMTLHIYSLGKSIPNTS